MGSDTYRPRALRLGWLVLFVVLAGCATVRLPSDPPTPVQSYAMPPADSGFLDEYADRIEARLAGDDSAYWLLDRGDLALSTRLALTDLAVSTLDIQYFIWEPDETGRLLAQRVVRAADRGVRVRLLIDDILLIRRDDEIAGLDYHPNIEVRVFNPWRGRNTSSVGKALEFLTRPGQLNHRMHNKIFVADNRFGIVGGRNIGNRYFGLNEEFVQNDLDVMLAGSLVTDLSESFDAYWNSDAVYTGAAFANGRDPSNLYAELTTHIERVVEERAELLQAFDLSLSNWQIQFEEFIETAESGVGHLHYDSPRIHETRPIQLYEKLSEMIAGAEEEILISSPYFIPGDQFCEEVRWLTSRGVRVAILTNSLESNNNPVAHTGYKYWRRTIIEAGAELYELRGDAASKDYYRTAPVTPERLGLHSKAIVVDGRAAYIGSMNLDPRSINVNTELGVIVEVRGLAQQLSGLISRDMAPENAWRVTLVEETGGMRWTNSEEVVSWQPAKGLKQRTAELILDFLPLKGLL